MIEYTNNVWTSTFSISDEDSERAQTGQTSSTAMLEHINADSMVASFPTPTAEQIAAELTRMYRQVLTVDERESNPLLDTANYLRNIDYLRVGLGNLNPTDMGVRLLNAGDVPTTVRKGEWVPTDMQTALVMGATPPWMLAEAVMRLAPELGADRWTQVPIDVANIAYEAVLAANEARWQIGLMHPVGIAAQLHRHAVLELSVDSDIEAIWAEMQNHAAVQQFLDLRSGLLLFPASGVVVNRPTGIDSHAVVCHALSFYFKEKLNMPAKTDAEFDTMQHRVAEYPLLRVDGYPTIYDNISRFIGNSVANQYL